MSRFSFLFDKVRNTCENYEGTNRGDKNLESTLFNRFGVEFLDLL